MDQRVVIITGGAKGIGMACARRFLADGYSALAELVAGHVRIRKTFSHEPITINRRDVAHARLNNRSMARYIGGAAHGAQNPEIPKEGWR